MGKRIRTRRRQIIGQIAILSQALTLMPMRGDAGLSEQSHDRPLLGLDQFVRGSGITTVIADGDVHDPYFSGMSLLCAHELGLSIEPLARSMLAWLLPQQRGDGGFSRYCLRAGRWTPCMPADADDSMCAIVIELIAIVSTGRGIRTEWQSAIDRCQNLLARLKIERGTYNVSMDLPVQLLMDNCEVYRSLVRLSESYKSNALFARARDARVQANTLGTSIVRQFWQPGTASYLITSQNSNGDTFYPDATGQLFPLLVGLHRQKGTPGVDLLRWIDQYANAWLAGTSDHYPWGLMAMALHSAGHSDVARRWLDFATPLRTTNRWNVLEEAIYQGLSLALMTK